jgi:hypothetical protein
MIGRILSGLLLCLLLASLTSCLKKWPPFWRDVGQGRKVWAWKYLDAKVEEAQHHVEGSDILLRDIADIILELRANTENLEDILKRLKDEDDDA